VKKQLGASLVVLILAFLGMLGSDLYAQLQQSGGPGSTVTVGAALPAGTNVIGKTGIDQTTPGTTNAVSLTQLGATAIATGNGVVGAGVQRVAIASDNTAFSVNAIQSGTWNIGSISTLPALAAGSNIVGFVRALPAGCTQTTRFSNDTVGVATAAGTSVTATTTCVSQVYVNNITNAAVTFRFADKSGTPVIWVGGGNDFSVPANSNMMLPGVAGITFTSGITAIAGTGSALNLHVEGWQ
jgi:hypothetical protein